ncbi:hypothetical protein AB0J83_20885 [Actinoplanes sp. NPDC049596]|uniref:hypothetical protein n=1 Tax=unclassified Actinoplanes TaxID=2626549 RepID=UPI00343D055F
MGIVQSVTPAGQDAENGWYANGNAGWWTLGGGSYTGDGCDGRFADMPMSGSDADSAGQSIVWGFQVGSAAQSCTLSLYVPTSSSARDVAARSAHFAVVHGTTAGMIGVKLTNRGDPNGYAESYPHLAGGAVGISCVAE